MATKYKTTTQAQRIFDKFGGARRVADATGHDPSCVYRWTYPRNRGGTAGVIPLGALIKVRMAARLEGIVLTDEDLSPVTKETRVTEE